MRNGGNLHSELSCTSSSQLGPWDIDSVALSLPPSLCIMCACVLVCMCVGCVFVCGGSCAPDEHVDDKGQCQVSSSITPYYFFFETG